MAQVNTKDFSTLPVGRLGLIPLQSCSSLGAKVNDWLVKWRAERQYPGMDSFAFEGYKRDSYIIDAKTPRFGSGEGKCTINESVRGDDGRCDKLQLILSDRTLHESYVPG